MNPSIKFKIKISNFTKNEFDLEIINSFARNNRVLHIATYKDKDFVRQEATKLAKVFNGEVVDCCGLS